MSKVSICEYYNKVDKIIQFSGTKNETVVRNEFSKLLSEYAEKRDLLLIPELPVRGTKGKDVIPDGTLKNILRLDYGYWESKNESLNLKEEIDKKIKKGYPLSNILFEDSNNAVLYQNGEKVMDIDMMKVDELDRILNAFVNFEKPEIRRFNDALKKFQEDIPIILETFRDKIDSASKKNKDYIAASEKFLELCKAEINPDIVAADIREMMIQHILTSDIFNIIFGDSGFHRHNSIARELEKLIGTLFTYSERKNLLANIQHYYDAINVTAASISDHHEKQIFLKALYENFYKAYNPKAADRLGVVYTPNEIVDFMLDGTNYLLEKHFKRFIWDKNVEILDPATGTGTFICNLIDKCPKQFLTYKYKNELHANEVAILSYYIASLNIEFTYKQKMNSYEEFPNICFVDTLDNTDALAYTGKQHSLFGLSSENTKRISRQNSSKISVIIGNPPYNANQKNENENNKNREYPDIDKRIKDTFVKYSTAQKTKLYDMYARFYRYAFDRLDNNGIVAFVTNRSFIDSRAFDGFRKRIEMEFDYAYIIDTKSDIRANPKISGTTHNVFGIQAGVAIMFLVKKLKRDNYRCFTRYFALDDFWKKAEKLNWLRNNTLNDIPFEHIQPDKNNNWINIADTDFETLLPLASKDVKLGRSKKALFELFTTGVNTSRDEWVFDINSKLLAEKINYFIERYTRQLKTKKITDDDLDYSIKWSDTLKSHLKNDEKIIFDKNYILNYLYRPFFQVKYYSGKQLSDRLTSNHFKIFGKFLKNENKVIAFSGKGSSKQFSHLAVDRLFSLDLIEKTQCLPLYCYDANGNRIDNITDWGLSQFVKQYGKKGISKEKIFYYVYAVLHNPAYRKKYILNLGREFPRIPFYEDFKKWSDWGKALMDLHINYETAKPFNLVEHNYEVKAEAKREKEKLTHAKEPQPLYGTYLKVKAKLTVDKYAGIIDIDELTYLSGVPEEAWEYKLGNRSAIEWVLDQYKEKKPTDATIAEKFDTYSFADYKEKVIDLLKRVCTVSVETMKIVEEMRGENN